MLTRSSLLVGKVYFNSTILVS